MTLPTMTSPMTSSTLSSSQEATVSPASQRSRLPALVWRLLLLYLLFLLALVPLGAYNQQRYQAEWDLIDYKKDLLNSRANLRIAEAKIRSPETVRAWAFAQGMVPNAEVDAVSRSGYQVQALPLLPVPQTQIEVQTTWR